MRNKNISFQLVCTTRNAHEVVFDCECDSPRAAPKMLVFVAVAALTNLQFDDKATVLLECTGSAPSTPIYFPELIALLRHGCQAFHRLGFLSSMPSDNNLEGLLSRAMLEQGRRSTGEALTRYEARNMIRELVARSFELSRVLNAGPLAGGGMSSFMRTMMHPWQQLVKGLIGPADFQVSGRISPCFDVLLRCRGLICESHIAVFAAVHNAPSCHYTAVLPQPRSQTKATRSCSELWTQRPNEANLQQIHE